MHSFFLLSLASLAVGGPLIHRADSSTANSKLPPVVKSVSPVVELKTTFPHVVRRDGGGGGCVDGKNIINFADTTTRNEAFFGKAGYYPFVSNSIAVESNDSSLLVHDFGKTGANGFVKQQWPYATTKTPLKGVTSEEPLPNHRIAIWPNTNILSGCDGTCGWSITDVFDLTYRALPYSETFMYSTLSKITLGSNGPNVTREVVKMWLPNEINYGSFGMARSRNGTNHIYMFASPKKSYGVKVARICESMIADKNQYSYWNGETWANEQPDELDTKANILDYNVRGYGPGTGEIFWSEYLQTWIAVFNDAFTANSVFRLMYSLTEDVTGPWSTKPIDIFTTPCCEDVDASGKKCSYSYNFATHAYPHIDPTGKTLRLGWVYNGHQTMFTTIEFA